MKLKDIGELELVVDVEKIAQIIQDKAKEIRTKETINIYLEYAQAIANADIWKVK